MKLRRLSVGCYQTVDGRYNIEKNEDYEQECNCVHCRNGLSSDCPRNGVSWYFRWIVWDNHAEDYAMFTTPYGVVYPGPDGFDTKSDAVGWLEYHLGRKQS